MVSTVFVTRGASGLARDLAERQARMSETVKPLGANAVSIRSGVAKEPDLLDAGARCEKDRRGVDRFFENAGLPASVGWSRRKKVSEDQAAGK